MPITDLDRDRRVGRSRTSASGGDPGWAERWSNAQRPDGSTDYHRFVTAAVTRECGPNGIFGARVMWETLAELVDGLRRRGGHDGATDLEVLVDAVGPTAFVFLRRRDVVAQAVSWVRAEQTRFWHPGEGVSPGVEPVYDAGRLRDQVATITAHNAGWASWFAAQGVVPLELTYEELTADPPGVVVDVLDFLGLDPASGVGVELSGAVQGDEINAAWIRRFRSQNR